MFVEAGRVEDRTLVRINADGKTQRIGGIPSPAPVAADAGGGIAAWLSYAGRVASDGGGRVDRDLAGVIIAADAVLLRSHSGLSVVAGDSSAGAGESRPVGPGDGGPASSGRFKHLRAVATDVNGNAFVADEVAGRVGAVRIRFINRGAAPITFYAGTEQELTVAPGGIDTIAGIDGPVDRGDGEPATRATFTGYPFVMAVAGDRLYVIGSSITGSAVGNGHVRLINLSGAPIVAHGVPVDAGEVETLAGGRGSGQAAEDGEQSRAVSLSVISGAAANDDGDLLLAEPLRHRVWKVDNAGKIMTFAGSGGMDVTDGGFNGNERPAAAARLNRPLDVKVGPGGLVYISDQGNAQVRVVDSSGIIHSFFGNGAARISACMPATGSLAGAPSTGGPAGIATGADGSVYVALESLAQVKRLEPDGSLFHVVGALTSTPRCAAPPCAPNGDGGNAAEATLVRPTALAAGPLQTLYILDRADGRIRVTNLGDRTIRTNGVRVRPGTIETVAGTGVLGARGDGGPAIAAQLGEPLANRRSDASTLAVSTTGELFFTDGGAVRLIDRDGVVTTLLPGMAADGMCCARAGAIALDKLGNLYIADSARVWLLNRGNDLLTSHGQSIPPGELRPVAGSRDVGFLGDGGAALAAELDPGALAVDGDGGLYIASPSTESADHSIRRVDSAGVISTIVGGARGFNGDGLRPRLTAISSPIALAVDGCGNLLFSDQDNDRLRRLQFGTCGDGPKGDGSGRPLLFWATSLLVPAVLLILVPAAKARLNRTPTVPTPKR
ncbi:MAG TPA: hypothetical protein VJ777_17555 [Mycobacterium sp.]|nr:hypothetical protein [Mycobacterium sp.]